MDRVLVCVTACVTTVVGTGSFLKQHATFYKSIIQCVTVHNSRLLLTFPEWKRPEIRERETTKDGIC
jgi:hypothetical protein